MITVNNLIKQYADTVVLNIPYLTVPVGESFGLVGNNGAGKTTFFRACLDLIRPTDGVVTSKDVPVDQTDDWKKYTGSYLDEGFIIDYLKPEEYVDFIGKLHGMPNDEIDAFINSFIEFFNDEIVGKNKFIRDLSKGNQKKVGIAAALMANPEILILDEPFANLDPSSQIRLKNLLNKIRKENNVTMMISSHDLSHVTEVCDRIVILDKGDIVHDLKTGEDTLKTLEEYFTV